MGDGQSDDDADSPQHVGSRLAHTVGWRRPRPGAVSAVAGLYIGSEGTPSCTTGAGRALDCVTEPRICRSGSLSPVDDSARSAVAPMTRHL